MKYIKEKNLFVDEKKANVPETITKLDAVTR